MATDARIGLLIPSSFGGTPPSLQEYTSFFRTAEELEFDSLWVIDRIFHNINILDPMTLLACAASVTSRVRLGSAVILFVLRNPVLFAKAAATLDHLSGGRLVLGLSLGGRDQEFEALGIPIAERVGRLREGLSLMRRLWSEDGVTFHGRHYQVDGVSVHPKPAQGDIPVLMGGRAEAVFRRSARAEGWVAGGRGTPQEFAEAWQKVLGYAQAAGRDTESLESAKLSYVTVGEDRQWCIDRLREYTSAYYGSYDVEEDCILGTPEECAEKIQGFLDAGAKTMILGPTWPDRGQITRIAREVVPLLK